MKPSSPLAVRRARHALDSGASSSHAAEVRPKAAPRAAPKTTPVGTQWTRAQLAAMGVESDAAIALDAGCCAHTVARERGRRGIAAPPAQTAEDLPMLDGDRLAARRWKLNLSQAQLGRRLGCNASRVCHLESGHCQHVTQQTLDNLAQALDCAPADLLRR